MTSMNSIKNGFSHASRPEALAALNLAKLLEKQGETEKAADAYLVAYSISPALLDEEHVSTILKAGRAKQLVDVLTPHASVSSTFSTTLMLS